MNIVMGIPSSWILMNNDGAFIHENSYIVLTSESHFSELKSMYSISGIGLMFEYESQFESNPPPLKEDFALHNCMFELTW